MEREEHDWIFDFVLQFLESDKFDAAVMDFVDEKCFVFDCDEENKFIYTDIHHEFKEHIEALISSNLEELGITPEIFFESCEKSRNNRDINMAVFERMIAMDDFQTFKKIMIKRNVELQLEAMQSYKWDRDDNDEDDLEAAMEASLLEQNGSLPDPEELRALKESEADNGRESPPMMTEEQMQDILRSSLLEMELLHRQEELEQAELEQAVAISLSLEEERLRLLYAEAKKQGEAPMESDSKQAVAEEKGEERKMPSTPSKQNAVSSADDKLDLGDKCDDLGESKRARSIKPVAPASPIVTADPKPLKGSSLKPLRGFGAALPPIGKMSEMSSELKEKRQEAEDTLRRSQQQLTEQRKQEDVLRRQINTVDPEEAARRAKHMSEQRDKLLAMKKAEREKKVREEEAHKSRELAEHGPSIPEGVLRAQAQAQMEAKHSDTSAEDEIERKRSVMRLALARRMKMDLMESEEAKVAQLQEDQFAELDRKLRQVEQLRSDNRKRETVLSEQLRRQQANIARNVQRSAAALKESDDL